MPPARVLLALLLVVLAAPLVPSAPAEASIGLGVAPSKLDLGVQDPGTDIFRAVTLKSTNDAAIAVRLELHDYVSTQTDQIELRPARSEPGSSAGWLEIEPTTLTLAPGEVGRMDVRMLIPADAEAGGHYAMLVLRFEAADPVPGTFAPKGAVNVPVLVVVSGEIIVRSELTLISSSANVTSEHSGGDPLNRLIPLDIETAPFGLPALHVPAPIAFRTRYAVIGNAHLTARARTTIKDMQGNVVAVLDSGPYTALPNSELIVEALWETPGGLGLFTAFMQVDDGTDPPHDFQRFVFVIAPWKTMLIALLALMGLGWLVRRLRRRARPV